MPAPKIDYGLAMPMLIVFGVALLSVLVEAFAPRRFRYPIQVTISILGLLAAFVAVVKAANGTRARPRPARSWSTGRPCSCRARCCCSASSAC